MGCIGGECVCGRVSRLVMCPDQWGVQISDVSRLVRCPD